MNILGVGGWELVIIFLIMLVVAGPKRMIQWSYVLGKYLGQMRILWGQMVDAVQKEFDDAGVDVKLPREVPTRQNINRMAQDAIKPVRRPVDEVIEAYSQEAQHLKDSTQKIKDSMRVDLNGSSTKEPDDKPDFGTWSGQAEE